MVLMLACLVAPVLAQEKADAGPTNEKARKDTKKDWSICTSEGPRRLSEASKRRTSRTMGIARPASKK